MDDKYLVTKETAEKMKESLREFISEFEKENGYPCYEEDFLEKINEGLDNGINMSPFLKLDIDDEPIFSINHIETYIQSVKDGNEDIAKNVSTVLKIDDDGHFRPLFSWINLMLVNKMREIAKTLGEPGKFDVLLSTDERGLPAYTDGHIKELYSLVKETNNINIDALLEKGMDGKCLYDNMQMNYLVTAVKEGLPVEPLVEIREGIEDYDHDTSYGSKEMHGIGEIMEAVLYEMMDQKREIEKEMAKYFVTEETAKKMKESFKNINTELEKKGYYNCFDDKLVEKVNEGLDDKIDMSPFLKLNVDNTVVLSGEHAEAYIRAVKRGNGDIARNVTTILKVDDDGHFMPLFDYDYMRLANNIDNNLTKKPELCWELDGYLISNKIFSTDVNGFPAYNINHIKKIHSLIEETFIDEEKNDYYLRGINHVLMVTGRDGKCLYDDAQTEYMVAAIKEPMPVGLLVMARRTIEDNNHDTSYGSADMNKVAKKMETIFFEMHELGDELMSNVKFVKMIAEEIIPSDDHMRELYRKDRNTYNLELEKRLDKICDCMHEQLEQKRDHERGDEL